VSYTVDKIIHLSNDRAEQLTKLASEHEATEDTIIEKALDLLFSIIGEGNTEEERHIWQLLSMKSLERVWDNDADAVYDNWRNIYDIPER